MSIKTSFSNLCAVLKEILDGKVDKVSGKGLSTNDFTAAYKTKLDGIAAGANKTIVDSALSTTSTNPVQNKVVAEKIGTIETNVSAAATTAGNAAASAAAVKKDLANYYKKTETYSQAEINNKISAIPKFSITVCEALPDSNISKTTVYLLKSSKEETNNLYDEYIYVNSKWEKLGTQTVGDIAGLSQRMTAAEANIKQNTSSISTINANVAKKQDKLTAGANITISGTTISAKDTTYSVATTSTNGLMSKDDKKKLNGIAAGANKTIVDSALSTTSTNPVQNKAVGLKFQDVDSKISGLTEKVVDTGWVEVEFPEDTSFDSASYLLYRRCGNMVSLRGKFNVTKNDFSSDHVGLALNLPKEDVAPKWLSDKNPGAYVAEQPNFETPDLNIWTQLYVYRDGLVLVELRSSTGKLIRIGRSYTINVTYML